MRERDFNPTDTLYHVTQTKNVNSIKQKGILLLQPSNWIQAGSKERYGDGSIFAFEDMGDAVRWAAKWDWDLNKNIGTGKISVLSFVSNKKDWKADVADPIGQAGAKGKWLKNIRSVPAKDIKSSIPVTLELVKQNKLF